MRRSLNILALAKSTSQKAHKAGRGRTLSDKRRRLLNTDNVVVLRGKHIAF